MKESSHVSKPATLRHRGGGEIINCPAGEVYQITAISSVYSICGGSRRKGGGVLVVDPTGQNIILQGLS